MSLSFRLGLAEEATVWLTDETSATLVNALRKLGFQVITHWNNNAWRPSCTIANNYSGLTSNEVLALEDHLLVKADEGKYFLIKSEGGEDDIYSMVHPSVVNRFEDKADEERCNLHYTGPGFEPIPIEGRGDTWRRGFPRMTTLGNNTLIVNCAANNQNYLIPAIRIKNMYRKGKATGREFSWAFIRPNELNDLKGIYYFLYAATQRIFSFEGRSWDRDYLFRIGSNADFDKNIKYRRSREFQQKIIQALTVGDLDLLQGLNERAITESSPELQAWLDDRVFPGGMSLISRALKGLERVPAALPIPEAAPQDLVKRVLVQSRVDKVSDTADSKKLKRIQSALKAQKARSAQARRNIRTLKSQLSQAKQDIESNAMAYAEMKRALHLLIEKVVKAEADEISCGAQIESEATVMTQMEAAVTELQTSYEETQKLVTAQRDEALVELMKDAKMTETFQRLGVEIIDIQYRDKGGTFSGITNFGRIDNGSKLIRIHFRTLAPTKVIPIGRDSLPSMDPIAAGPFEVQISKDGDEGYARMDLRAAHDKAIIGVAGDSSSSLSIKVHPHTPGRGLETRYVHEYAEVIQDWQNCCLGELQAMVRTTFKKNDLVTTVVAVLQYLQNAYTTDSYGAFAKFFPTWQQYTKALELKEERQAKAAEETKTEPAAETAASPEETLTPEAEAQLINIVEQTEDN